MSRLSPIFTKMSGTQNSFFIIDTRTADLKSRVTGYFQTPRANLAQDLCQGKYGVTADGLIFIEEPHSESSAFKWDFYNADGSGAEMCGNAARCVTLFFQQKISPQLTHCRFETAAGLIEAQVLSENDVKVTMSKDQIVRESIELKSDSYRRSFQWINTGVPHIVTELHDVNIQALKDEARVFRSHPELGKKGANVTYYERVGTDHLKAYSYERGVEEFTLSCGTGAVAAAIAFSKGLEPGKKIQLDVRGGSLFVERDDRSGLPTLTGEATFLFEIRFNGEKK